MSKTPQSLSYVKEFNSHFQIYQRNKTESSEHLLNRSLSLQCSAKNLDVFHPDSVDNCQFYINLYSAISSLDPKSDTLWLCISVLQQASKNLSARQAIVGQFRFIPLFAKILTKITAADKIHRLLTLLQDLTYGFRVTWDEPYLSDLVNSLVNFILGEEESLGFLSLSVLVNICYKNPTCVYLVLRTANISVFTSKIRTFGFLANKMLIILDNNASLPSISDLKNFIKKSFSEMENCLQSWNVPYLRHIVEFITNSYDHKGLYAALKDYPNFCGDMGNLIQSIEARLGMDDLSHGDENIKNQQICVGLIFNIFDYILELTKDDKLLSPIILKIFNIVINWIEAEHSGANALNVVRTIIRNMDKDELTKITTKIEEILPKLIENWVKDGKSNDRATALLKLLITLLKTSSTESLVLSNITDSYFDIIFSPLIAVSPEMLSFTKFSENDLAKYLFCLLVLVESQNIAKSAWIGKIVELFRKKQIQFVIAKGLLSENEEICGVVFEIARYNEFPRNEVSKIVSQLRPLVATRQCAPTPIDTVRNFQKQVEDNRIYISKASEERLDKLITHIIEAKNNGEFDNVATSELIEMFNFKINLFSNSERNLEKRLEDASSEITNLSHRLSLQSNETTKFYSMNFKLQLMQERYEAQISDLTKQVEVLKKVSSELSKKVEIDKEKIQNLSKVLDVKEAKEEELYADLDRYKRLEAANLAEIKQLHATNKEYAARIEKFKTNILRFEEALNENRRTLEEKEKEILKAMRTNQELKESNLKSESLIKHLESQLVEKNEAIRTYEAELNETEEMRKTILSLMEGKKPKRKP